VRLSEDTLSGDTLSGDTLSGDTLSGDTLSGDTLSGDTLSAAFFKAWQHCRCRREAETTCGMLHPGHRGSGAHEGGDGTAYTDSEVNHQRGLQTVHGQRGLRVWHHIGPRPVRVPHPAPPPVLPPQATQGR
jgi:hypothetical protein